MPKEDKQKVHQPKPALNEEEKKELQTLTKALVDFLKDLKYGMLDD